MGLATFLDAAYALQVREATRLGVPLLDVVEKLAWQRRQPKEKIAEEPAKRSEKAVADQNARSLAALEGMMSGVKTRG
jgi:hypothetical protein